MFSHNRCAGTEAGKRRFLTEFARCSIFQAKKKPGMGFPGLIQFLQKGKYHGLNDSVIIRDALKAVKEKINQIHYRIAL